MQYQISCRGRVASEEQRLTFGEVVGKRAAFGGLGGFDLVGISTTLVGLVRLELATPLTLASER